MKHWLVLALILGLLLSVTTARALDLQVGIDTDVVIERDIRLENLGLDADYSAQYYDLTLETKVGEWLTLTPKAGLNCSKIEFDTPVGEVEANNELGWNVGLDAQADIYTIPTVDVDLALIGSYRFSKTEIDEIDIAGLTITNPIETTLSIHEWEAGVIASKNLGGFGVPIIPYIGVVYSDLQGDVDVNLSMVDLDEDIEARDNVGLRLGFDATPLKDLTVGVDVKLIDQTAVSGKISYRF